MKSSLQYSLILLLFLIYSCQNNSGENKKDVSEKTSAHSQENKELFNEIYHMDSVMFNAFNSHDLEEIGKTFSTELEFYHDKGGLTDYTQTMLNFKSLFERNKNTGLRRDLVENSIEVYPIKDYGAVEIGLHRFCHVENGKDDCGTFKFIQLWKKKDGQWKVSRVISYDH